MIDLYLPDSTILSVQESDTSFMQQELMGEHTLTLIFSLPKYADIPEGTYCYFMGQRFTLNQPFALKKNAVRNLEYTLNMEAEYAKAKRYKLRNTVDKRLQFSMCAKPHEFLETIVDNMNMRDSDWIIGDCIEATERTIEFDHAFLLDALQMIADEFNTEWEIVGKKISLGKVEYFKNDPLPLSYGRGNGFCPGVGRTNDDDKKAVDVLFVQGGDRNIDRSIYGSKCLLLPKSQTLVYDGKEYVSDADGLSIQRKGKAITAASNEDSLDCSEIYPSRVGEVTSVEIPNAEKNFYDIIDNTIPDNLNYNDYIIAGESITIRFQSGMLSALGVDFDLKYKHSERRFELVPQEIDGEIMPNEIYKPRIGDKYAIFGCMLPEAYYCDNATQTGASWDMFREGAKYLAEHEVQGFTFTGELQGKYAKENWLKIGGRLMVGSYIHFTDNQFASDGVDIRITGIKQYMHSPYSPTIELSNTVKAASFSTELQQIEAEKVAIEERYKDSINFTKRTFRDARELMEALQNAMLEGFSERISPLAIQTMQMLVGDESLQFRFVNGLVSEPVPVQYNIVWDNNAKQLVCSIAYIQHLTLGINTLAASHEASEYKLWHIPEYRSPVLDQISKYYYLYAKCSKTAQTGEFVLSESGIGLEAVSGYYHLLVGILNSEYEGDRSFVTLYGFTEILPGRITTDKIISQDGNSWFDLVQNAFKLGNSLTYQNGVLTIASVSDLRAAISTLNDRVDGLDLGDIGGANLFRDWWADWGFQTSGYSDWDKSLLRSDDLEDGHYILSGKAYSLNGGYNISIYDSNNNLIQTLKSRSDLSSLSSSATRTNLVTMNVGGDLSCEFDIKTSELGGVAPYYIAATPQYAWQSGLYKMYLDKIMLQKGSIATAYQPYTGLVAQSLYGSVDIVGGMVLGSTILLKDANNVVYSGWTGLYGNFVDSTNGKNIVFWSGGTIAEARAGTAKYMLYSDGTIKIANGKILLNADGSGQLANGKMTWTAAGYISIGNGNLTVDTSGNIIANNGTFNNGIFKGTLQAEKGIIFGAKTITTAYTITIADVLIVYNGDGGVNIKLPSSPNAGQQLIIRHNTNGASHGLYIEAQGTHKIIPGSDDAPGYNDGAGGKYYTLSSGDSITLVYANGYWYATSKY